MTGVSLIIPTYNRAELLKSALQSLIHMEIPPGVGWEVLVIDNNCTDETVSVVDSMVQCLPVRRVAEVKQGLCFARNRAIHEAVYEHLIYLDDDILVSPSWVRSYLNAIETWTADVVVGPVTPVYPEILPTFATSNVLTLISSRYSQKGLEVKLLAREVAHEIPGCNFGVRKAVALELGGFDPRLDRIGGSLLSGGDWDFGRRLVDKGMRVIYHPECSIRHIIGDTKLTRPYLRRRAFGDGVSRAAINAKYGLPLSLARRLQMVARMSRFAGQVLLCKLTGRLGYAVENEIQMCACAGTVMAPCFLRMDITLKLNSAADSLCKK